MRRLASLLVLLVPLALCQYQQNQRYQPQQWNGQQQQQQYNPQQQQQQYGQQNQQFQGQRVQPMNPQQGYQQQGFQQQNGQFYPGQQQMNRGSQKAQSGRTEVVNSPTKLLTSEAAATGVDGAQVDIRLTNYRNLELALSNTTTCSCPLGHTCDFLPSNGQNNCMFSFMTVISAKEQSVQFIQSDFYPFSGEISTGNWTNLFSFPFPSKPVAIDIFVQHLGVVIEKGTTNLRFFNHLTLVDEFTVDIASYVPTQNQNQKTYTLTGKRLNTQLNLVLSVQCINGMMGDSCDYNCPTVTTDNVICTDSQGRNSSCRWSNSYKTQVTDCIVCSMVGANGTCAQVIREQHIGVAPAFRTWTIVLGVLLGVALLVILCLIVSYVILRSREAPEEDTTYRTEKYSNGKAANRPLLEDEWATPRRPMMPERPDDRQYGRDVSGSVSRQEHQV